MLAHLTAVSDVEKMKKDVSLLNVMLDLGPSEQVSAASADHLEYGLMSCIGCQDG